MSMCASLVYIFLQKTGKSISHISRISRAYTHFARVFYTIGALSVQCEICETREIIDICEKRDILDIREMSEKSRNEFEKNIRIFLKIFQFPHVTILQRIFNLLGSRFPSGIICYCFGYSFIVPVLIEPNPHGFPPLN